MAFRKKSTRELVQNGSDTPQEPVSKPGKKAKSPREKVPRRPLKMQLQSKGFLGGICLVLALVLAFIVSPALAARKAATVEIVTIAEDVPFGTKIVSSMLSVREMGAINLPAGAVTDPAAVVDKYLTTALLQGDILTTRHFQDNYPTDDPELLNLGGRLAMSVSFTDLATSVSSKIRAGDIIQLLAVLKNDNNVSETPTTAATVVPELQAVEVLIVTNGKATAVTADGETGDNQIATVVLSVDRQQAAVLAGLNANATLHAALVTRGDETAKDTYLLQQETLLSELEADGTQTPDTAEVTPSAEGGTE